MKAYTPWSVMKHIQSATEANIFPQSYWEESGVNWILDRITYQ